ncbi:MAG TPA: hypothetical protein VGR35_03495 [Tepidisphaeraceae bacterium]|nr:hypothetical protein [Tepidisphaeraceae bacterium]
MRYFASFVVTLAWALWLGGMVALVLFVQTLFARNRPIALEAAPMLFVSFERVQLVFAAAACVGTFCWWVLTRRRPVIVLFALFAIAGAVAALSTTLNTDRMEQLRAQGMRESPEFQALHRRSTSMYVANLLLLLAAGAILPAALKPPTPPTRVGVIQSGETAPGTAVA